LIGLQPSNESRRGREGASAGYREAFLSISHAGRQKKRKGSLTEKGKKTGVQKHSGLERSSGSRDDSLDTSLAGMEITISSEGKGKVTSMGPKGQPGGKQSSSNEGDADFAAQRKKCFFSKTKERRLTGTRTEVHSWAFGKGGHRVRLLTQLRDL